MSDPEFPAVKLGQLFIVIVLLQGNPLMFSGQVFNNRGLAGVGRSNHKIYMTQIHVLSPS